MSKLNSLLMGRFKAQKKEKMNELVERSASGNLSSFSGVFQVDPISESEKISLKSLLEKYQNDKTNLSNDLSTLAAITSEVKAISNQAVILHGERIKRAQELFKTYNEGAFSTWLLKTYGNRQTPYNFMQYYELYNSLSKNLQSIIDEMPRQAIYSLSSRPIPRKEKVAFIENYKGETKTQLLERLRDSFPLPKKDKRNPKKAKTVLEQLKKAEKSMRGELFSPSLKEREEIQNLAKQIYERISNSSL